jgi:hypothetical protein
MLLVLLERLLKARHKNLPQHRRPPHPRPPEQAKNMADNSRATKGGQITRYGHEREPRFPYNLRRDRLP